MLTSSPACLSGARGPRSMAVAAGEQTVVARPGVAVEGRPGSDIAENEVRQRRAGRVSDDLHAESSEAVTVMLDGDGDQKGLPVHCRAPSIEPFLRYRPPTSCRPRPRPDRRSRCGLTIPQTDLLKQHPGGLVAAEAELLAELSSRDACIEGGSQVHRPEPGDEWQSSPVQDRASGERGLLPARRALPPATLHQLVGSGRTAGRADEPCRPASARQVADARGVVGEIALELEQAAWLIGAVDRARPDTTLDRLLNSTG